MKAAPVFGNLSNAIEITSATVLRVPRGMAMRTLLDVANTYEDWARKDDEMANFIIARLRSYEPETWSHQLYDASALREGAQHFRAQAKRLREKHRHALRVNN